MRSRTGMTLLEIMDKTMTAFFSFKMYMEQRVKRFKIRQHWIGYITRDTVREMVFRAMIE